MKVAYLVLAHHQPKHLARLIKALSADGCAFFVHIDAKADESVFRKAVGAATDVTFIQQRTRVNWGGYSMVGATLSMLRAARESGASFDRYCLMSGSDFPIKPIDQVVSEFGTDKEFLRIDRWLDPSISSGFSRRIRFYFFRDVRFNALKFLSGRIKRKAYADIPLYHGSSWWALTNEAVEYIFGFLSENEGYVLFMKRVHCPDETFFHSIVKASPFADRITHDYEFASDQGQSSQVKEHGAHYVDWPATGGSHPKILGVEDFDDLVASKALFGRKFDEQASEELIAMLESAL